MTTTQTETRTCKTCGEAFTARVVTGVVNCPDCREQKRGTPRRADEARAMEAWVKMGEAQARGRAARAAGDAEAEAAAVADFRFWTARRDEARRAADGGRRS